MMQTLRVVSPVRHEAGTLRAGCLEGKRDSGAAWERTDAEPGFSAPRGGDPSPFRVVEMPLHGISETGLEIHDCSPV